MKKGRYRDSIPGPLARELSFFETLILILWSSGWIFLVLAVGSVLFNG